MSIWNDKTINPKWRKTFQWVFYSAILSSPVIALLQKGLHFSDEVRFVLQIAQLVYFTLLLILLYLFYNFPEKLKMRLPNNEQTVQECDATVAK